jgi:hypothetical protein
VTAYLILLVAVVVGVDRGTKTIERVEGSNRSRSDLPPRRDRWRQASGVEKTAFVVMAACAAFWLLLILPIGFTAAVTALGIAVWRRPYLELTLAPVAVVGGLLVALYDVVLELVRDDGGWGATVVNAVSFGGLWIIIGLLLRAAGARHRTHVFDAPSTDHRV